jgi:hypothetical protein
VAMPPTRRINRAKGSSAEGLAARLPDELRSFDAWHYNSGDGTAHGLKDYLFALSVHVAPHEAMPVMNCAGLSAANWYRHMLSRP